MQLNSLTCPAAMFNRMAEVTKLLFKAARVRIEFTKEGWQQLLRHHPSPVSAFIQTVNIKADLGLYIASYEERGIHLDSECQEVCYQSATPTKIDGIFFTKYEPRLNATKKVESLVRTRFGSTVMDVAIRKCSKIPESSLENTDVVTFAPSSNAAEDYQRLGDEILRIAGLVDGDGSKEA